MYNTNCDFQESIRKTAKDYLNRIKSRGIKIHASEEEAINLSINFIFEECAVYNLIVEDGYVVDIYPGTYLPILNDISNGFIGNAPKHLQNKINVQIKAIKK